MHVLTALLAREAVFLLILAGLGAGPAAFLSERFDAAGRLGLAPLLGFCLGTCVATTLLQFEPANDTYWVLIPIAVVSIAVALWRTARAGTVTPWRHRLRVSDLVQLALVCVVVAAPLSYVLREHHTVGPAAYYYTDVDNYVGRQDGMQVMSIATADRAWSQHVKSGERFSDVTHWVWSFFAQFDDKLEAGPLDANVDALLGLQATATNSSFLIVLLLMGALGAFSSVRYATRSRTWMGALAGSLFGGAFFLELWFDTFQAAIVGIGLILPLAVLFWEAMRGRRWADRALLALVLACEYTAYQLFIPMLAVTAAGVLAVRGLQLYRGGRRPGEIVRTAAPGIVGVVAMSVVFDVVGVVRTVGTYQKLAANAVGLPRVGWKLPIGVVPGWLAQTREFWDLPGIGSGGFGQFLLAIVVPLVFLGFVVLALRRHRAALALVLLAAVFAVAAEYAYVSNDSCTYCGQRDLLPIAPIVVALLALGLAAALATPRHWLRALGMAGVVLVVLTVGLRARTELTRFSDDSYFLDSANRSVLGHLPQDAKAVQLEGYAQTFSSQSEQPLVYYLADEVAPGRVSILFSSDLGNAIQYLNFGVVEAPGPEFRPDYDYVLTRFAGIKTARRVIARSGAIALEQRTQALDITPQTGLNAPFERLDPSGTAWVQPGSPLTLDVVGTTPGRVWAKLTFTVSEAVAVPAQAGVRARQQGSTLVVCVPATGTAPVRNVSLQLSAAPVPGPVAPGTFPPPEPAEGIALSAMRAVAGRCSV